MPDKTGRKSKPKGKGKQGSPGVLPDAVPDTGVADLQGGETGGDQPDDPEHARAAGVLHRDAPPGREEALGREGAVPALAGGGEAEDAGVPAPAGGSASSAHAVTGGSPCESPKRPAGMDFLAKQFEIVAGERQKLAEERQRLAGERQKLAVKMEEIDEIRCPLLRKKNKDLEEDERGLLERLDEKEKRLDEEKKRLDEKEKRLDEEKKRLDEEKKRLDEEKKRLDEEKKRLDEEKKRLDEEKKRLDEKEMLLLRQAQVQQQLPSGSGVPMEAQRRGYQLLPGATPVHPIPSQPATPVHRLPQTDVLAPHPAYPQQLVVAYNASAACFAALRSFVPAGEEEIRRDPGLTTLDRNLVATPEGRRTHYSASLAGKPAGRPLVERYNDMVDVNTWVPFGTETCSEDDHRMDMGKAFKDTCMEYIPCESSQNYKFTCAVTTLGGHRTHITGIPDYIVTLAADCNPDQLSKPSAEELCRRRCVFVELESGGKGTAAGLVQLQVTMEAFLGTGGNSNVNRELMYGILVSENGRVASLLAFRGGRWFQDGHHPAKHIAKYCEEMLNQNEEIAPPPPPPPRRLTRGSKRRRSWTSKHTTRPKTQIPPPSLE